MAKKYPYYYLFLFILLLYVLIACCMLYNLVFLQLILHTYGSCMVAIKVILSVQLCFRM